MYVRVEGELGQIMSNMGSTPTRVPYHTYQHLKSISVTAKPKMESRQEQCP